MEKILGVLIMFAMASLSAQTILRLPPTQKPPTIDGKINAAEWSGGSVQFGAVSRSSNFLTYRGVTFYFAYDDNNIYFGHCSELPPKPIKPGYSGDVQISLTPPGADKACTFSVRRDGAISGFNQESWMSEMIIPLKKLGISQIEYGKPWKLQMTRVWRNRDEIADWAPDGGIFIPEKDIPAVSFFGLGENYRRGGYNIELQAANPNGSTLVQCEATILSTEEPHSLNETRKVASLAPAKFGLFLVLMPGIARTLNIELRNPINGKVYYRRSLQWDIARQIRWRDPAEPIKLDMAVYPTKGKVKCRLYCDNIQKLKSLQKVEFQIADESGHVLSKVKPEMRTREFYQLWTLPALAKGKYFVQAVYIDAEGKKEQLRDDFLIRKFPWEEGKNLGREPIIVPPFVPLRVNGLEVHGLLTGYRAGGLLWDQIYSQGENILAAPIELMVNGQRFNSEKPVIEKKEADQVVFINKGNFGNLKMTVRQEYDYDGMCKVTLGFDPNGDFHFQTLYLDIPLKSQYAKQFHSSGDQAFRTDPNGFLPEKNGRIWDSHSTATPRWTNMGSFRPYIWFGELYKGMSICSETPRYWTLDNPKVPTAEIIRENDKTTLRLNIISRPTLHREPFNLVFGFQPTPVKPRPADFRKYHGITWGNPLDWTPQGAEIIYWCHRGDKIGMDDLGPNGWFSPPGNDWSFYDFLIDAKWKDRKEVTTRAKAYLTRHGITNEHFYRWRGIKTAKTPDNDLVARMYQGCNFRKNAKYIVHYYNPRQLSPEWPERDMYVDEWYTGLWRPARTFLDEYNCDPMSEKYADFLLYHGLRQVRRGKADGIYYDNIYLRFCIDGLLGPVGKTKEGSPIAFVPIFGMRELLKRTAIMLTQEKKFISGRPALFIHTSNLNIVPFNAWATVGLDWEMNFGTKPFPVRFDEAHMRTITLGTQCGLIPALFMKMDALKSPLLSRSLIAMAFAYDVLYFFQAGCHINDRPALDTVYSFGYGDPIRCTVYPGYEPKKNPVKSNQPNVRVTTVRRQDGKLLLMVGNLGKACRVQLALPDKYTAKSQKSKIPAGSGRQLVFDINDYDYSLIELSPQK